MELLELAFSLLLGSVQGCGCFLELLTALVDFLAGAYTAKHWKRSEDRMTAQVITMICLMIGAMALTALVTFKWLAPRR